MINKIFKLLLCVLIINTGIVPAAFCQKRRLLEIEIHPGDTLYKFAERYLDDPSKWPELLEYNEIPSGDPDLILPGDKLFVPTELVKDEIADIVYLKRNVRMRRKNAAVWKQAELDDRLYPEDGVRTYENSLTRIQYLKGGKAQINENSLVFLRPQATREDVVKLDVGELMADDIKVLTDSAAIDPEKEARYLAKVDEEKTTTLSVYKGKVDFISSGKVVMVDEGFMSVAELNEPPSKPMKLPDAPEIKDISEKVFDEFDGDFIMDNINFEQQKSTGKEKQEEYVKELKIQVAEDKNFSKIVLDKKGKKVSISKWKQALDDGEYWWRVAFIGKGGVMGGFSEPSRFVVDTSPPEIIIKSPENKEIVKKGITVISGDTEKGAVVYVNGEKAKIDENGSFVSAVKVANGVNKVEVKAVDSQNRTSVRELEIIGKTKKTKDNKALVILGVVSSVLSIMAIVLSVMK
ncbi:MAG: LysM peptidoglycan-binding domain-containing protein [Elusimicrobiota bacterium]